MEEQKKSHEKINDKTDINNLPDKEFKALVNKKISWIRQKNRLFLKELENIKKN